MVNEPISAEVETKVPAVNENLYPSKRDPVFVSLSHVSVKVKATGKTILDDVSVSIGTGLTAIMGPTGAGKTALLNCITGLISTDYKVTGDRRINGSPYTAHEVHFGFAPQVDELNGNLTVKETLMYAARLQLPFLSPEQREERVMNVIDDLQLTPCTNVLVGSPLKKGISGGQRKRVSIALAMLTNPTLLVLDEPTAGLDSTTALNLLSILKNLATMGHTIIAVIHQPQKAIYDMLDRLILIRSTELIYVGQAKTTITEFQSFGYFYDLSSNPADYIMEVISPELGESPEALKARCKVRAAYVKPEIDLNANNEYPIPKPQEVLAFMSQLKILTGRRYTEELRKTDMHILEFWATCASGLLIGAVWYNFHTDQASVAKRLPAIFFVMINQSLFGAMQVILSFPDQRSLMLRERRAKMYSCAPCALSWFVIDFVFSIPWSMLFAIITYFMFNLQKDAGKFFLYFLFLLLEKNAAASIAQMVAAIARVGSLATTILPAVLETCRLFGGFFLPPTLLPDYFVWLDPFSYVKYAYVGAAQNELRGLEIDCPMKNVSGTSVRACVSTLPTKGEDKMVELGLDFLSLGGCVGCLICFLIGCRLVAYMALRWLKW